MKNFKIYIFYSTFNPNSKMVLRYIVDVEINLDNIKEYEDIKYEYNGYLVELI